MVEFLRHCESFYNVICRDDIICQDSVDFLDCGLSPDGIKQAGNLKGVYDLVIVSPLRRCINTLEYSQIRYNKLVIEPLVREYRTNYCDFLENEDIILETEDEIFNRLTEFKTKLKKLITKYKKILVVTHADFIWYLTSKNPLSEDMERFGVWLENGEIYNFITD